jgi:hypothetical protein
MSPQVKYLGRMSKKKTPLVRRLGLLAAVVVAVRAVIRAATSDRGGSYDPADET